MTAILTLQDHAMGTDYVAQVIHKNNADRHAATRHARRATYLAKDSKCVAQAGNPLGTCRGCLTPAKALVIAGAVAKLPEILGP